MPKNSRRKFIKKAAYVAPAVVTLTALPALAQAGSQGRRKPEERRRGHPVGQKPIN